MKEHLMCSNVITWKCGRASAEIMSYARSWCSRRPHDCAHTIVPRHVCAQTRLCPHTLVPTHVCAHTRLSSHICAQTRLCPHMFMPRHICALTCYNRVVTIVSGQKRVRLCPDTYLVP